MTYDTLPIELRTEALAEVMEYFLPIFQKATDKPPSDADLEIIAKEACWWIEVAIPLLYPPVLDETPNNESEDVLFDTWQEKWYEVYVLRAQLIGFSENTARAVIDHLHGRTA
jgi:hypothetical protein